jgi:hypothetical protein
MAEAFLSSNRHLKATTSRSGRKRIEMRVKQGKSSTPYPDILRTALDQPSAWRGKDGELLADCLEKARNPPLVIAIEDLH